MHVLRSNIHCIKYAKTRASSDPYFPVYVSVLIMENADMICLNKEKCGAEKARISAYFTQ